MVKALYLLFRHKAHIGLSKTLWTSRLKSDSHQFPLARCSQGAQISQAWLQWDRVCHLLKRLSSSRRSHMLSTLAQMETTYKLFLQQMTQDTRLKSVKTACYLLLARQIQGHTSPASKKTAWLSSAWIALAVRVAMFSSLPSTEANIRQSLARIGDVSGASRT